MENTRMPSSTDPKSDGTFDEASASEVRGAIDKGQTGEKVAGFDPAASPMETDAEAGGAPTVVSNETQAAPSPTSLPTANASSHGSAMRPFDDAEQPTARAPLLIYAGIIVVVAIVLIAGVYLAR
jgi:cobalamin biosynthesis Mg chelatase CobN